MLMSFTEPVVLFLFAHQDDEFGVFQKIIDERTNGRRACCAYLTDGGSETVSPERRNRESISILKQLGVEEKDIFFAGSHLKIGDARLPESLELAANWIQEWISGFSAVEAIYIPAWEGGHHDHDALHAITVCIAQDRNFLSCVRQFSLYNGYRCRGPMFRVCLPLPFNGKTEHTRISWKRRMRFLGYCLGYPSQAKTWLGLFPFVMLHYLSNGMQTTQPASYERIGQRPHQGALYYERRGFYTWEKMRTRLAQWRNTES
jgi:LmbE family N-acetylglucosaminyl deacetylase